MQEYYVYTLSNLVAEVGGYLGLFLGASLLTILESILGIVPKFSKLFQ